MDQNKFLLDQKLDNVKKRFSLEEILADDPLELLGEEKKRNISKNSDDKLLDSFEEINDFIEKTGKEPTEKKDNINEFMLFSRLKWIRKNNFNCKLLKKYDRFNLLPEHLRIETIEDIFNNDILEILDDDESKGLFDLKHIPKVNERESTDFVAKRKPCKNFKIYENKFKKVQKELASGIRKLIEFEYEQLKEGNYYIYNGVLLYLESVRLDKTVQIFNSGVHHRPDGRTRIIFENGTMSNMTFQSLYKGLHNNGRTVSNPADDINQKINENFNEINENDNEAGYIYVLKSKSTDSKIKSIDNLFKIGYSTNKVEDRIKNAENEPTYLMAPVNIIASWKCYNMNPHKLEQLLHVFFGATCLEVDVIDNSGKRCTPREWFIVPFKVIEQAIELIIGGEVIKYRYDEEQMVIVER